jgi:drug/metabolite transporter (DMT)-like permease
VVTAGRAVVNTAVAYTVWNHTKRLLPAMQSTLINNTMLIHVAVLGWAVLGERLDPTDIAGLLLALTGVVMVQLGPSQGSGGGSGRREQETVRSGASKRHHGRMRENRAQFGDERGVEPDHER